MSSYTHSGIYGEIFVRLQEVYIYIAHVQKVRVRLE